MPAHRMNMRIIKDLYDSNSTAASRTIGSPRRWAFPRAWSRSTSDWRAPLGWTGRVPARWMKASSSDGYPQTTIEDLDTRSGRGVDPRSLTSLALGDWVEAGYSLLISGPTGAGKSWLACALAQYACRRGHAALYLRVPRLGKELRVLHATAASPNGCCRSLALTFSCWTIWAWLLSTRWPETICPR